MPSPSSNSRLAVKASRVEAVRLIAAVGAVIGALMAWIIITQVLSIELVVRSGGRTMMPVGPAAVLLVSTVTCLAGLVLLSILERKAKQAARIWTAIATLVTALSLAGPLSAAPTVATAVSLIVLHLVTAGVFVPIVAWSAFRKARLADTPA